MYEIDLDKAKTQLEDLIQTALGGETGNTGRQRNRAVRVEVPKG